MAFLKALFERIYYFFPVQLFILNLRRYPIFLLLWLLVLAISIGNFGEAYGAPNLFFDPEYLDKTGYLSFVIVGIGFGAFYVAWNINCYMLHNHRFHFLATYDKPMGLFFLNNSLLPLIFIIGYFANVILYQSKFEYRGWTAIAFDLAGFVVGMVFVILLTAFYYTFTNHDKFKLKDRNNKRWRFLINKRHLFSTNDRDVLKVRAIVTQRLKIEMLKPMDGSQKADAQIIFRQHHINAMIAQSGIFFIILSVGFFIENPLFQFPVIASVFLFSALLIFLFGSMIFWAEKCSMIAIVSFLLLVNFISKYDFMGYKSAAYGLDYGTEKRKYNIGEFRALATDSAIKSDIKYFTGILENWKRNQPDYKSKKPKLVFINASGGGSRSAMFSTVVLQHADSAMEGKFFDKIFLMTGASGGMLGLANMRQLYLERKLGTHIDIHDKKYAYQIAADMLNPIFVSMLSNDIFLPFHKIKFDSMTYFRDRGYMMEQQLIANVEGRLDKRLSDYKLFEQSALIPLVVMHTTVVNDSRRFFISPHPIRFLMRQPKEYQSNTFPEIDAIDFGSYFAKQRGQNLRFTSGLRMNATFPFILPNTELPTDPPTYVMDGGAADNFGSETTLRFIQTFKEWINKNTSGIIIIQIRDNKKEDDFESFYDKKTMLSRMLDPIGQFISNMENYQDFRVDQQLNYTNLALNVKLQMITFEYVPAKREEKAALSLHLTEREKRNIIQSLNLPNNQRAFELLEEWLAED